MKCISMRPQRLGRPVVAASTVLFLSLLTTIHSTFAQSANGLLPVHINVPANFKRIPMRCCVTPRMRILAYWAAGTDENAPNINILQTETSSTSIRQVLPTIVAVPGETFQFLGFETRCGHTVALLSSSAMRGTIPITGLQALIVSQSKLYTITYMHPSADVPDALAIRAVRDSCVSKPSST